MSVAAWPNTWVTVRVVHSGELIKMRTSNIIFDDIAYAKPPTRHSQVGHHASPSLQTPTRRHNEASSGEVNGPIPSPVNPATKHQMTPPGLWSGQRILATNLAPPHTHTLSPHPPSLSVSFSHHSVYIEYLKISFIVGVSIYL